MPCPRWMLSILVLAIAALGVAGCSGSRSGDEREITQLLTAFAKERGEAPLCAGYGTGALVRTIYGGADRCRSVARNTYHSGRDLELRDIRVTGLRVDGDTARARLVTRYDGVTVRGQLGLARRAERWRIDELSAGYLRTRLRDAVAAGLLPRAEGDFSQGVRRIRECIAQPFERSDAEMKRFGYDALGQRNGAGRALLGTVGRCMVGERVGRAALRTRFEAAIGQTEELDREGARCVVDRLRRTVPSRVIARYLARELETRGHARMPAVLRRSIADAGVICSR